MTTDTTRRAVVIGAALLPVTAVTALPAAPDPIFAAIEAEKAAEDRFVTASAAHTDAPAHLKKALEPASDEATDAYFATLRATMATVPTTAAGLLALVDRFEVAIDGIVIEAGRDGLTELLATVRAFVTTGLVTMAGTTARRARSWKSG